MVCFLFFVATVFGGGRHQPRLQFATRGSDSSTGFQRELLITNVLRFA